MHFVVDLVKKNSKPGPAKHSVTIFCLKGLQANLSISVQRWYERFALRFSRSQYDCD